MKKQIYISAACSFLFGLNLQAQEKDKNLGTEEVRVVKAYEATVLDAFKVKEIPNLDDAENNVKKEIKYTIYSFPVASTFVPEKGKAAEAEKDTLNTVFNNYALLGYGNYNTLRGELGIAEKVSDKMYVVGMLNHISSQGGINGLLVDDKYSKSNLDFNLGSKSETEHWRVNFGVSQNNYNWYGLPTQTFVFTPDVYENRNFGQKYNDLHFGGLYKNEQGAFRGADLGYKYFWDDFDSKESHLKVSPKFDIDLNNTVLKVDVLADYVNTQYEELTNNKYNYLIVGAEPSINLSDDEYNVQLGFGIANISGNTFDDKDNSVVVYPKIKANYTLVNNIVVAYAGAEGGVENNTYANFSALNPYVSPNLMIKPTKQQYNFYVGLQGKLYHNISYNVRAGYGSEEDKAMFYNNAVSSNTTINQVYEYGNSFGVTYDLVKTFNLYGELNLNFTDDVTIDLTGEYNSFSADLGSVYNLPQTKFNAKIKVDFTDQWFAGLDMFFVGKRNDLGYINTAFETVRSQIEVDAFADLNVNVGYKPTDNWTIFANANNLFNQSYKYWNNYKVQGTQILVGAMYKFNFKK